MLGAAGFSNNLWAVRGISVTTLQFPKMLEVKVISPQKYVTCCSEKQEEEQKRKAGPSLGPQALAAGTRHTSHHTPFLAGGLLGAARNW